MNKNDSIPETGEKGLAVDELKKISNQTEP
jgi:hypothetical protein